MDANIYFTLSNLPATHEGGEILSSNDGETLTTEIVTDDQGLHDAHEAGGAIWVSGTDPDQSWSLGNVYTDAGGSWEKRRFLPLTIHTWGLDGGASELLAAVGAHTGDSVTFSGRIMRSTDGGLTWPQNVEISAYRAYDVKRIGARIFAVAYPLPLTTGPVIVYSDNDGVDWTSLSDQYTPDDLIRLAVRDGNLLSVDWNRQKIYEIDSSLSVSEWALPTSPQVEIGSQVFNVMAVNGLDLYILDKNGIIYKTSDFVTYDAFSYVPNGVSLYYWSAGDSLMVSSRGTGAQIWRVPLS